MDQQIVKIQNRDQGKLARNTVAVLSWYPFFWAITILIGSYFKSTPFIYAVMFTWLIAFYLGTILWVILTIWLLVKKLISIKKVMIFFLIAIGGISLSACVWIYDIFDYGFRYFD